MCVPECQNGGVCSQPNICDCVDTGYTGDLCQMCTLLYLAGSTKDGIYFLAQCIPDCQNEGVCSQPNTCDCTGTGYEGN